MIKETWSVLGPTVNSYYRGAASQEVILPGESGSIEYANHDVSRLGRGDQGGPLFLSRSKYTYELGMIHGGNFDGSTTRPLRPFDDPDFDPVDTSELIPLGTTAIARTTPTNPIFDASVFIGEAISGGAPGAIGLSTMRDRALRARNAGSDYLSYQFGWVPLVNDVKNLAHAVRDSDAIIHRYIQDSDRKIRENYTFPPITTTTSTVYEDLGVYNASAAYPTTSYIMCNGSRIVTEETKTWFSGAFRYHIPVSAQQEGSLQNFLLKADKLYGVRLNPEVLWNLAPWSWAADWFGNVGDILHNVSELGNDGLVLQYGYMMRQKRISDLLTATGRQASSSVSVTASSRLHIQENKTRIPATPYGFGIDLSSLSAKQVSILVALGLSKT